MKIKRPFCLAIITLDSLGSTGIRQNSLYFHTDPIMVVIPLTSVSFLLATAVSSLVLQLPQSTDGQLDEMPLSYNTTTSSTSRNPYILPSNFSTSNALDIECDQALGIHMQIASCVDALHKIPQTLKQVTLGERGTGQFDIVLPYRYLSCKLLHFSRLGEALNPLH